MMFNHIVCGGTFDHFHLGHERLLSECLATGKVVSVGITDGAMIRHKSYAKSLESYEKRVENVSKYNPHIKTVKLTDICGPTLTDPTIDAIFVTKDTEKGAIQINKRRVQIGMKPLHIQIVPFVVDESGAKISSERIREGRINRCGVLFEKFLLSRDIHIMPESLKQELRDPLGHVREAFETSFHELRNQLTQDGEGLIENSLISVGDMVTYNLKTMGIQPHLSIIDGMTCRKALNSDFLQVLKEEGYSEAPNKKGTIQKEAVQTLIDLLHMGHKKATKQLFIHGEEDLLTLVAILLAPLHSHVFYGLRNRGAVDVFVTENIKEKVYNLIIQFTNKLNGE